ncbi:Transposase IS66 family protein [Botrimarina colliarenosi]|uniref:Transposase IS66 family protein n=1 Tax=Botrimarina colliarenosi TaxID=2528001 RepID=A0A5C6AIG5_9BACT|nr:transposase [Botrimarina colliarenosi]TWT99794.1 Transposase IS66 family protein [Botrimarina colliarenosi]
MHALLERMAALRRGRDAGRCARHAGELFTFLWRENVDPTNNHAERKVRPALSMRKNSYQNAGPAARKRGPC